MESCSEFIFAIMKAAATTARRKKEKKKNIGRMTIL